MCGIAGIYNWGSRTTLEQMADVQSHRGPDDSGVWEHSSPDGSYVGLASRRLAILDLSQEGHMPMSNDDGSLWITYNGEIYNFREIREYLQGRGYRFHSASDTEVVLKLYELEGAESVRRLNGIFAFAICDLRGTSPKLFIARDHFGVKPLYYVHRGSKLALASEAKALFCVSDFTPEIDREALHQYLTFLWVPEPGTMFSEVAKLPAGHYAVFQNGEMRVSKYWDLAMPSSAASLPMTETELVEEVRERFFRAVRRQMVSDVPIGAFLSSGLDSTGIVAAMASASNRSVKTYTIGFAQKHRVGEQRLDDTDVAARTADYFGCEHTAIFVEPDVAKLLPELIWHMDDPVADPAIILAYLVCREARRTATVLLSGVGGDELFAGYRKHVAHYWAQVYRSVPTSLSKYFLGPLALRLPTMRKSRMKGIVRLTKKMARSGALPPMEAFLMNSTYLDRDQKARLYEPQLQEQLRDSNAWRNHEECFGRVADADFLNQMLYVDSKQFMPSLNLNYNDKMSMAASVEVRVPFLDLELAEFVASKVPPYLKLNGRVCPVTKYVFRKALRGLVPGEVLRQRKAGFFAPVDNWLAEDLKEMVGDLLSPERLRARGLLNPAAVAMLMDEQQKGRNDWSMQIWSLLTLELWMQAFSDRAGRRSSRDSVEVHAR